MKYHFIHERGDYPVLAIEDMASAWSSSIKKAVGWAEDPFFLIYENGWCRIYSYQSRYDKIVDYVFRKINKNKDYVKKVKKIFIKRADDFLKFQKQLLKTDFKELSNQELIELKRKYSKFYHRTVPYGEPLPYFLKEKLQQIFDDYLINELKMSTQDYQVLVTPSYQSFLTREKSDLFKIQNIKDKTKMKRVLKEHAKKYEWILFDYASLKADEKYFRQQLKEKIKLVDYENLVKEKNKLVKKYKINPLFRYYLQVLEDLYFLMDYKKEVFTKVNFAVTPLYREAGWRIGLSLSEVRWLSWSELKTALLKKKKMSKRFIQKRRKSGGIKFLNGKTVFLTLKRIKAVLLDIKKDEGIGKIKEIKGIAGSSGKASGEIRYLKSANECSKMAKGKVLLVSNTTPDFMPAIRKARAIVTNEGGITCHAAIISRELGLPCVIGTKVATKVLKDGDLVEVDAEKGVVKILK